MPTLSADSIIGGYRILGFVGAGAMGEVYRATHVTRGGCFALKVLAMAEATASARFRNEAVIQYNLRHPNIAALYEYIGHRQFPCLVMEYVDGETILDLVQTRGPLPLDWSVRIMRELAGGFAYMHGMKIVHRDIKSSNIRINSAGVPKVLDFGIAFGENTPKLTKAGLVVGTLQNLAPEQVRGFKGDARSDIWALGVLFYEMVTGALPFDGSRIEAVAADILAGHFKAASDARPGLPKWVDSVIGRCLRVKPEDRFPDANALLLAIERHHLGAEAVAAPTAEGPGVVRAIRKLTGESWALYAIVGSLAVLALGGLLFLSSIGPAPVGSRGGTRPEGPAVPAPPAADISPGAQPTPERSVQPSPPPRVDRSANQVSAPPPPSLREESGSAQSSHPSGLAPSVPILSQPSQPKPPPPPPPNPIEEYSIRVETFDGQAEVYSGDQRLGPTPYTLRGPYGRRFDLLLKRAGFHDRPIQVQIGGKKVYSFDLQRR
jgi:serine/threonine-protein kinase